MKLHKKSKSSLILFVLVDFSLYFFFKREGDWGDNSHMLYTFLEPFAFSWIQRQNFTWILRCFTVYLDMLHTIFISKDPIGNTLASSTISTFLTITCNRGSNPHPDLIFKENIIQSKWQNCKSTYVKNTTNMIQLSNFETACNHGLL
jgi:hypothetical protein